METCAPPFYCLTAAAHGLLVYVGVIAFAGVWQVLQSAPRRRMISAPTWGAVGFAGDGANPGLFCPGREGVGHYSGASQLQRSALDWLTDLTDLTDFSITGVKKDLKRKD